MSFIRKLFKKEKNDVSSNCENAADNAKDNVRPDNYKQRLCWISDHPADANSDDPFERAKAYAFGLGVQADKEKAARLYREAMNQGNKKAKHNLALMYLQQEGGLTDIATGIQMLQELAGEEEPASEENLYAISSLANCYMDGVGVEKDVDKALELYQVASDKGLGIATYAIGAYHINVCRDIEKGVKYCEKAADQGFPFAAAILAQIYEQGMGVAKNSEKSLAYLKRAAELGNAQCQLKHGMLQYYDKDGKDSEEGMEWMMKSAQQGFPPALYYVGREFLNPDCELFKKPDHFDTGMGMLREAARQGVEDASQFLAHFGLENEQKMEDRCMAFYEALDNADENAAQQAFQQMVDCCRIGDPIAQVIMGSGYYYGTFVMPDKERGWQLVKEACASGCPDALDTMSVMLNEEKRYDEALPYIKQSAEKGDMHGLHNLGNAYFYGRGVEPDLQKAFDLWVKAAQAGNPNSYNTLGNVYFFGDFVEQDLPKAIRFYSISANHPCTTQARSMKKLVEAYRLLGDEEKAGEWENRLKESEKKNQ